MVVCILWRDLRQPFLSPPSAHADAVAHISGKGTGGVPLLRSPAATLVTAPGESQLANAIRLCSGQAVTAEFYPKITLV